MYLYETHLHTYPVSKCARASVKESLEFYKSLGYDGVFVTNHFLDGNINIDRSRHYKEKLDFYFSDYEEAVKIGGEIGIKVFLGVETSYAGTDFLLYGLSKDWYYNHPEWQKMTKKEQLIFFKSEGALVIQAHPYRDSSYIDHIRLFPNQVDGVEILNASRPDFENGMAKLYAEYYNLLFTAGSDNHAAERAIGLAGLATEYPLSSVEDFVNAVREKKTTIFRKYPEEWEK